MAVLKFAPFRFRNFLINESTFFGHKSLWKGTGVSRAIDSLADLDMPAKAAAAANSTISSEIVFSSRFSSITVAVDRRDKHEVSFGPSDSESLEIELELEQELDELDEEE